MAADPLEDWIPCPVSGLRFRELEDGAVLLDSKGQKVHSLNPWATIVWLLCDGARPVRRILEVAGGDADRQASIREVLETFRKEGLVEPATDRSHAHHSL